MKDAASKRNGDGMRSVVGLEFVDEILDVKIDSGL